MAAPDTSTGSGLLSNFGKLGSDLRKDNSKLATDVAKDAGKIVGFGSQTAADGKQSAPVTNSADQDNNQDAEKVDIDFFRREKNEQNLSALFELPVSNTILESQPLLALRNEMYESDNASQYSNYIFVKAVEKRGQTSYFDVQDKTSIAKYLKANGNDVILRAPDPPEHVSQTDPNYFTEEQWQDLSIHNSLLFGFNVTTIDQNGIPVPTGIASASLPAFKYKARKASDTQARLMHQTTIHAPTYDPQDRSNITMLETENVFQSSLMEASFARDAISASTGGSAFGFSASASAGYEKQSGSTSTSSLSQSEQKIYASYEFTNVSLHLDESCLEFTDHFVETMNKVKDASSLASLFRLYGKYYTTSVDLGARLFTSASSKTVEGSDTETKMKSFQAKADASFSYASFNASVKAEKSGTWAQTNSQDMRDSSKSVTWNAIGGDKTLAQDPAAWVKTVDKFESWRKVKKDGVNHILDMVGRFQGQGPLADNLKKYANNTGDPNIHAQPDVIVFSTTELEDSKDLARYFAFHKEKSFSTIGMTLYGTASWYRKNAALYKELQSGPTKTEFPKTEHRFEVLDLEGGAVRGERYETTRYRLCNVSSRRGLMVSVMRTDPPLLVSANEDRGLGTAIGFRNAADLQKPDQQKQRAGTGLSKGDDVCIMVYRGIKESDIIWGFIGEYRVTTEGRKIGIPSIVEDESKALRFRVMRETMATAV